jgi:IS605 OrfB family transposase
MELYGFEQKRISITIPKHIRGVKQFKEMRFIPKYNGKMFVIQFVYDSNDLPQPRQIQKSAKGFMSIDTGVTNFLACTTFSNGGSSQFIVDGRYIKSVNHHYNKEKARLQGEYSHNTSINGMGTSRFMRISSSRENKIDNYFDNTVKFLIKRCFDEGLSKVIVGYNEGQKQGINVGRVNNQTFVSIPYDRFRQKLKSKCDQHGIECIFQEESYTSKASCLDGDEIPVYEEGNDTEYKFSGKRVKRGLYKSKDGLLLNADINGSVNILRKYLSKCNAKGLNPDAVRALVNAPCLRVRPLAQATSFREG